MKQFLYTLEASRLAMLTEPNEFESEHLPAHNDYVQQLLEDEVAIFAGATTNQDSSHFEIVVFLSDNEDDAKAIMNNDPAVEHRIMRGALYPHTVSLWNADAMTLDQGQQHYFYRIRPIRPAMIAEGFTEFEGNTMGQHFGYLQDLTKQGIFAYAGPTLVADNSNFGAGLLRADSLESAWEMGSKDPAVVNRVMRLDIFPFESIGFNPNFDKS